MTPRFILYLVELIYLYLPIFLMLEYYGIIIVF